jgi:hypothetical protein
VRELCQVDMHVYTQLERGMEGVSGRAKCTRNNAREVYHPGKRTSDRFRAFCPELASWPDTWKCRNENALTHC